MRHPDPAPAAAAPVARPWRLPGGRSRAIVLAVAVAIAFGPAARGELVWDDATVVGAAAQRPSLLAAFGADLFALGDASANVGASYWRPLVTASFYLDAHASPLPLELALHLTNLAWHALAAILVARALARWVRAVAPSIAADRADLAGFLAAIAWAVLPIKAENVAWISGRGDVIGLALLLSGLELRRLARGRVARVALAVIATAAALLAKEAFVVAGVIVAIEVAAEGAPLRRAARSPEVVGSLLVGALYLVVRSRVLRVHGGGEAMFAGLDVGDRVGLVLETVGHAVRALALPTHAELLRGPVGFSAPFVIAHEPWMAAIGALAITLGAVSAATWRRSRAPIALFAGTFAPVSNLVPTGLESRLSDRFLYVPSLGIALALTAAIGLAGVVWARRATAAVLVASLALAVVAARRSLLFRSEAALFGFERLHGDRATSILVAAGTQAIRARRYAEARDLRLEAARRYAELGFAPEAFPYALEAVRLDTIAMGEAHLPSYRAYARALGALFDGRAEDVAVPLSSGDTLTLATGAPEARAYAESRRSDLGMRLFVLTARSGSPEAGAAADDLVASCDRGCGGLLLGASRVHLARLAPARARELLARVARPSPDADALVEVAGLVERALASSGASTPALATAKALFGAEAFRRSCREGAPALTASARSSDLAVVGAACLLGGLAEDWERLRPGLGAAAADLARDPQALRLDPARRAALLLAALP